MWLMYALGSALLSGSTALLAKYGIKKVDSDLAVALRSVVILAVAWMVVLTSGSWIDIGVIEGRALIFPLLAGITNALSWLSYFKALRLGAVNQVAAIDKAGITLTMIGGWLMLGEKMTWQKGVSIVLILIGARLMVEKTGEPQSNTSQVTDPRQIKSAKGQKSKSWLFWAVSSAVLTATTTLLSKAGVARISSEFGFAIRTGVMFIIAWSSVLFKKMQNRIDQISRKSMLFVGLSGLTTAFAWLCYFRALASTGAEAGIVQPVDKLSILVSVGGAWLFFKEKLKRRTVIGLIVLVIGVLILLI